MMVEFRRLKLRDLNAIEVIERSSYPTPWSRSMFAGELAKPSSTSALVATPVAVSNASVNTFDLDHPAVPSGVAQDGAEAWPG